MIQIVALQVGEQGFTTISTTLTSEGQYFKDLMAGKKGPAQADGSWFIDANPEVFEHLLEYMRTKVYPLFWDEVKGFDRSLYSRLAYAARSFDIESLRLWIDNREYQDLIRVETTCRMVQQDVPAHVNEIKVHEYVGSAASSVELIPSAGIRKIYLCPRRIPVHKGRPDQCGRACIAEQGDDDDEFEDQPVVRTFIVKKEVTLLLERCKPKAG
jgi:BTB/POZ domain-containing protein KCTD9